MATQYTRIFPVAKTQSLMFDTSKTGDYRYRGSGFERHLPTGQLADGSIFRGLIKCTAAWAGMYKLVSAHLVLMVNDQKHLSHNAPELAVGRITEYWASQGGSEGVWTSNVPANSKYPGPNTVSEVTKTGISGASGNVVRVSIIDIVETWAPSYVLKRSGAPGDGVENHGVRIRAPGDGTNRLEVWSHIPDYTPRHPYIEVVFVANHPPNAPTVVSPAPGSNPAIVSSEYADHMELRFYFSDVDAGNYCPAVEVEVYTDGATDGAPGTRLGYVYAGPTYLGPGYYAVLLGRWHEHWAGAMPARTPMRYRIRTMDNEWDWGAWTSLANGRFQWAYTVGAPGQPYMIPATEGARIYGTLSSHDPGDYITAWQGEFYRDTSAGSVTLWAPGPIAIGGVSTRSDIEYKGESLVSDEVVRWRHRHSNRDGIGGAWSPWYWTRVYAPVGPDALSPADTSTKLTSRTPTLTIGHSSAFTGYRWRLYLRGEVIYDSNEVNLATPQTSVNVSPPAGLLAWGDGAEGSPLEWEAQIRLVTIGIFGSWSPKYGIRINALPGATVELDPTPIEGIITTANPRLWSPYDNPDQKDFNEWPVAKEVEVRELTAVGGIAIAAEGEAESPITDPLAGTLIERRYSAPEAPNYWWPVTPWHTTGQQLLPFTSASGWAEVYASLVIGTAALQPTGYTGDSTSFAVTSEAGGVYASYDLAQPLDLSGYGAGAALKVWARVSSVTNLGYIDLAVGDGTGHYGFRFPALSVDTWTEVTLPLDDLSSPSATNLAAITRFGFYLGASGGSYTGVVYLRDWRIGTVANAKTTPEGPLENGESYAWRVRFQDDATAIMSTTLAAASSAAATNVKLTSVAGITVGDTLIIAAAGGPPFYAEAREVTVVGTAGAGGTGVTISPALTYAHSSGDDVTDQPMGGWSGWVWATLRLPPVMTPTAPTNGGTVNDPTPAVSWTLTAGSGTQASALVRVYRRIGGTDDQLLWQGSVTGTTSSLTLPTLLLEDGVTYAWEVVGTDTYGASGTSPRWTFTLDSTAPAALTTFAGAADINESSITLSWDASADTYFDHYRVFWRAQSGEWVRIDGGPEVVEDDRPKLTTTSLVHYGCRWGPNWYRVHAHNGADAGEDAYVEVELEQPVAGRWQLVCPDDQSLSKVLLVTSADRGSQQLVERHDPPGRNASVHIAWGQGPVVAQLDTRLRPSVDGDLSSRLALLQKYGYPVWVKSPTGWAWDPVYGVLTDMQERTRVGGMLDIALTFERTDDD